MTLRGMTITDVRWSADSNEMAQDQNLYLEACPPPPFCSGFVCLGLEKSNKMEFFEASVISTAFSS
jgi:hypothetical protein